LKGIDLSNQTRNQELARIGSITGEFATVDLSAASDTLAYNVVPLLFDIEWFNFLRSVRSQGYSLYEGNRETYHKFSSMGNGATFTIETLVFAAACFAVGGRSSLVYGDDIIIERDCADRLIALLAFLGFLPNEPKTHTKGPFRESCGKSWFEGVDVTPRYIRVIDKRKPVLCHLVNSLMDVAPNCMSMMEFLASIVRDHELPFVPYNGDSISGVWVNPHYAYQKKLIRSKHWILKVRVYQPRAKSGRCLDIRGLFLWYLRKATSLSSPDPIPLWVKSPDFNLSQFLAGTARIDPGGSDESSRYTISSHKYVRKWVHWIPVAGAPINLNWFTDLIDP
jgi:hypothetical protein